VNFGARLVHQADFSRVLDVKTVMKATSSLKSGLRLVDRVQQEAMHDGEPPCVSLAERGPFRKRRRAHCAIGAELDILHSKARSAKRALMMQLHRKGPPDAINVAREAFRTHPDQCARAARDGRKRIPRSGSRSQTA
jgi:hypothetical protein